MQPKLQRLQKIFLQAVSEQTPGGRSAVIDRECEQDEELRRWVEQLLEKHDEDNCSLDTPVIDQLPTAPLGNGAPAYEIEQLENGAVIADRYRVLDVIGHGGMGTVYRAEQFAPLRRTVAIKLIRPGLDSRSMLARFDSERQVLARLNHPNIAKALDAGTMPSQGRPGHEPGAVPGRPYFVMEFVDGVPINMFCEQNHLTVRQRIELFVPVCRAIEHAHQKGIIHRDLKPGNILVGERDGQNVPIVIDFGIAKSAEGQVDIVTPQTGCGLFFGTLDYMAPEQAGGHCHNVDTRTDVYALGAVLYELLSGSVPLDRTLAGDSVFDLVNLLMECDVSPPSTRAGGTRASELRGELDWVVVKCLEKDRDRRYPSAAALADDLVRYLQGEPVTAGRPGAGYRLRKWLRRHSAAAIAGSVVILALVGGLAGAMAGMMQAWKSEATALAALAAKEVALAEKEQERLRADAKAAQAKFIGDFLQFDVLRQANPRAQSAAGFQPDANLTVRTALDRAAASVEKRFGDKPNIVAALYHTIGASYDGLGDHKTALTYLRKSFDIYRQLFGDDDDRTMSIRHTLGATLVNDNRAAEAVPLFEQDLALVRSKYGHEHNKAMTAETDLANALRDLGRLDEAQQLLTHVYEVVQSRAPYSTGAVRTLINLAGIDELRGRFDSAIKKLEGLLELPNGQELDLHARLGVTTGLGRFYLDADRPEDGLRLLEASHELARRLFGEEHIDAFNTTRILADGYAAFGRTDDARKLMERCVAMAAQNPNCPDASRNRVTLELARLELNSGNKERAEALTREIDISNPNGDSSIRAQALLIRAQCLDNSRQAAEAEAMIRSALKLQLPGDSMSLHARIHLGEMLMAQRRHSEALAELSKGYLGLKALGHKCLFATRRLMVRALEGMALCAEAVGSPEAASYRTELASIKAKDIDRHRYPDGRSRSGVAGGGGT